MTRNEDKTKEQLIDELVRMRNQIVELRREITKFEESELDYMRGAKIGEILVEARCITISQLQRTLQRQKEEDILRHKRLGEIMVEQGFITPEERDNALMEQRRRLQLRVQ